MSEPTVTYFTAAQLARFCAVDVKTIHNWVNKGTVPHFRTPGRHLRFRPVDVLGFMQKQGFDVPAAVIEAQPLASAAA